MLSKIRQYFELIKYCFFGGITTLLNLALLYVVKSGVVCCFVK